MLAKYVVLATVRFVVDAFAENSDPGILKAPVTFKLPIVAPVALKFVVDAFNTAKLVVEAVTAANNVLVELVKIPLVAKNLVLVAFVVELFVAANNVLVALVNVELVAKSEVNVAPTADRLVVLALVTVNPVKKPFVKFKPDPEIAVVDAFPNEVPPVNVLLPAIV